MAFTQTLRDLQEIYQEVVRQTEKNRLRFDDSKKDIRDFRRIFDAQSAKMNQAIFNDEPPGKMRQEAVHTVSALFEILARL